MIRHSCEQYSPEWWALRLGVPTASQFHRIITPAKMTLASAHKGYIAELIGDHFDPSYGQHDDNATDAMRRGSRLEGDARRLYETYASEAAGRPIDVEKVGICLTDDGRFGSSPDGMIGNEGCMEFKCPSAAVFAQYVLDGVVPTDYLPQVHGHLLVTGCEWCDFFAFYPGRPGFFKRVYPDAFTEKLRERLEEFDPIYQAARSKFGLPVRIAAGPAEVLA